jgi:16S rRNA (guanine966-N2)-methyltransferase
MRVVAGEAKGTRLKSPGTGTRPMTDRVKEAVFSSLGDFSGLQVLDLYAGSGSLGLEALSRGAKKATFVESAREAIVSLERNIETTGMVSRAEVVWADVAATLSRPADERMDLIFVDPPYSMSRDEVLRTLESIVTAGFLSDDGKVVMHRPGKESRLSPLGLVTVWERDYGQATVSVFAHEDEEQ